MLIRKGRPGCLGEKDSVRETIQESKSLAFGGAGNILGSRSK
jgi:hypothetical protein